MASFKDKQLTVPAVAGPVLEKRPKEEEAEKYLKEAGWEVVGRNDRGDLLYNDPIGSGTSAGTVKRSVSLPVQDGGEPMVVSQLTVAPASWSHPIWEALTIQRSRDGVKK